MSQKLPADASSRLTITKDRTNLAVVAAGVVLASGQQPIALPFLALAGLVFGLALLIRARSPREAAFRAWLFGTAYFMAALHWLVEPFLVDVARHGWMAPFALVFMAGGLSLFWAASAWGAARLGRGKVAWQRALLFVVALSLAEFGRARLFTGFPWSMIGSLWVDTPIAGLAAWIGPHGLTLLTLLAVVPAAVWALRGAIATLAIIAFCWIGSPLIATRIGPVQDGAPVLRLVQTNAPQNLKWRADMVPLFWKRNLDFTSAPVDPEHPVDFVIWPEVSLPFLLDDRPDLAARAAEAAGNATLIAGAQRRVGRELRNALAVFGPDGQTMAIYDKYHLVPFGEYFPGGRLAEALGLEGLATDVLGGFSPGPGPQVIDLSVQGGGKVLPLICYEAIFPRHARIAGQRPDWILQLTNDAWFGNFAGPQQHLAQAQMRAIEQGLPVVRVANTGVTALIGADGKILADIPLNTSGFLDAALPPKGEATVYSRTGDGLALGMMLLTICAGMMPLRRAGAPSDHFAGRSR